MPDARHTSTARMAETRHKAHARPTVCTHASTELLRTTALTSSTHRTRSRRTAEQAIPRQACAVVKHYRYAGPEESKGSRAVESKSGIYHFLVV